MKAKVRIRYENKKERLGKIHSDIEGLKALAAGKRLHVDVDGAVPRGTHAVKQGRKKGIAVRREVVTGDAADILHIETLRIARVPHKRNNLGQRPAAHDSIPAIVKRKRWLGD